MGRVSNHAKMKMHLANVVLGDEKQSTPCIMAVSKRLVLLHEAFRVLLKGGPLGRVVGQIFKNFNHVFIPPQLLSMPWRPTTFASYEKNIRLYVHVKPPKSQTFLRPAAIRQGMSHTEALIPHSPDDALIFAMLTPIQI